MSIRTDNSGTKRITIAFIVIISILVTITMSGLYRIQSVVEQFDNVIETHNASIEIVNQILQLARDRSLLLQRMLLSRDPFGWDDHQMQMSHYNLRYYQLRKRLMALEMDTADREILQRQKLQTTKTGAMQSVISQHIANEEYEEARILFFDEMLPSQDLAMESMEQFINKQRSDIVEGQNITRSQVAYYKELMWFLLALGIIVSIVIAITVIHWLKREIARRNKIEAELEQRVKSRTEKLAYMATHDPLTSLPNRSLFNAQLVQALKHSRREHNFTALFFMDLDGFKQINDQHGHDIGDKVLIETCRRISDTIRDEDIFSRIGGDEFTLILSALESQEMALPVADKIIAAVNQPIALEGKSLRLGISIGISFYPVDGDSMDSLITRADDAMYKAKRAGKNHYITVSAMPIRSL